MRERDRSTTAALVVLILGLLTVAKLLVDLL